MSAQPELYDATILPRNVSLLLKLGNIHKSIVLIHFSANLKKITNNAVTRHVQANKIVEIFFNDSMAFLRETNYTKETECQENGRRRMKYLMKCRYN